ncbi:hypothetical protein [Streptomyces sp. NPDC058092]|uniref:hypothetical protein n=1 Tax=Streptomyces sp. NPDC058092 TaxID=3346336 RepID=UPI0036ECEF55
MGDPVFVVHGVAAGDPEGFEAAVASLQKASGVEMVPVYWGDLGAHDEFITMTLPLRSAQGDGAADSGLREEPWRQPTDLEHPDVGALAQTLTVDGEGISRWPQVEQEVLHTLGTEPDDGMRDGSGPGTDSRVRDGLAFLADAWMETLWLQRTDDAELLREAARALAHSLEDLTYGAPGHEADGLRTGGPRADGLRTGGLWEDGLWEDGLRTGGPREDGLRTGGSEPDDDGRRRMRAVLRRRLADLDRVTGAAVQAVAGRANHALRTRIGPGATRFLGDVLVYQRHQAAIHARVRETVDRVDPRLGRSSDHPVRMVAHSLGGVICVDMATAADPLWTSELVTFGSQAAFFHVCDPRGGQLAHYTGDKHVELPPSLHHWVNLWEPLDLLAFAAARVFRHHDGRYPVDTPVPHAASTGLWTHSAYWEMPSVAAEIAAVMTRQ